MTSELAVRRSVATEIWEQVELTEQRRKQTNDSDMQNFYLGQAEGLKLARWMVIERDRQLALILEEARRTITAAVVVYDHYRAGQPLRYARGETQKARFLWTFDAIRNNLFNGLDEPLKILSNMDGVESK